MSDAESKRAIEQALRAFAAQSLKAAATGLFNALGYASKKTLDLKPNGLEGSQLYGRPPEIAEKPELRSAKERHV